MKLEVGVGELRHWPESGLVFELGAVWKGSAFCRTDEENSSHEAGRGRGTLAGMCLVCLKRKGK